MDLNWHTTGMLLTGPATWAGEAKYDMTFRNTSVEASVLTALQVWRYRCPLLGMRQSKERR